MTDRRTHLHATDLAKIAGVSPHGTALDVFLEKTGHVVEPLEGEWLEWGNRLEGPVLDAYQEKTGVALVRNRNPDGSQTTFEHPEYPWLAGTPDAWGEMEEVVVDAKTSGPHAKHLWKNDEPPADYLIQTTVYCSIRKVPRADIPTLHSGQRFRIYPVAYDPEFMGNLVEIGERFLKDHLLPVKPPEPESDEERDRMARILHPREIRGEMKASTLMVDQLVAQLFAARQAIKDNEGLRDGAVARIEEFIGDAEGVAGDWGRALWRRSKDSSKVRWEQVARWIAEGAGISSADFTRTVEMFTELVPGQRRFLPQPKKEQ